MSPAQTTQERVHPKLAEIDEALSYAIATRNHLQDSKKHIAQEFIDDLLDERLCALADCE